MQPYVFDCENDAAEFIADVKRNDPQNDFTYVIVPDPLGSGKFFIEIATPEGRIVGQVFLTTEPNDIIRPIGPDAMPILLTTAEEWETGY